MFYPVLSPVLKGNIDHSSISGNSRNTHSYTQVIKQRTAYDDYGFMAVGGNTETRQWGSIHTFPSHISSSGQKLTRLNSPGNLNLLRHGH